MPFVPVPKDLSRVKTKIALNLTRRQLICFSTAAVVGLPVYFFTRAGLGNDAAVFLMIGVMLPFFFVAMYEKDGQPAEKIVRNYIRARIFFPTVRPYKTENLYRVLSVEGEVWSSDNKSVSGSSNAKLSKEGNIIAKQNQAASTARKASASRDKSGKKE